MITAIEVQAEQISLAGAAAGANIWDAIESAIEAGLPASKARRVFDGMLDAIVDDLPDDECPLFVASAYEVIPADATSTAERAAIDAAAWAAWTVYVDGRADDDAAQVADYRYDQMRDERMMAGVK